MKPKVNSQTVPQESFLDQLLNTSDKSDEIKLVEAPPLLLMKEASVDILPRIKKEDVIAEYKLNIEEMRHGEVQQLIKYMKEEDPETCINILFVLSQCQTDENDKRQEGKDELNRLMERLNIRKNFLVECMHTVLYDNLVDFFLSIGKQKHHIHQFESDSSSDSST